MIAMISSKFLAMRINLLFRVHALLSLFFYRYIENEGEKKLMKITFDTMGEAMERPLTK